MLEWSKLLNHLRRKELHGSTESMGTGAGRTEFERDYDRILFAAPTRRLADKTQVFPMEAHDSVRTRPTHSHEVSNLARSIGVRRAFDYAEPVFGEAHEQLQVKRNVPSLLAANAHALPWETSGLQGFKLQGFPECGHNPGRHRAGSSDSQETIRAWARSIPELRIAKAALGTSTRVDTFTGQYHLYPSGLNRSAPQISRIRNALNATVPIERSNGRCASMGGFKAFESAAITLAGIELAHRIRKRQFSLGRGRYRNFGSLKQIWDRALAP